MPIFNKGAISFSFLMLSGVAGFSQKRDSIPERAKAYVADKFPMARVLNLEYNTVIPYRYNSTFHGADQPERKVENFYQLKASVNINFFTNRKWSLGTILSYRYVSASLDNEKHKRDFQYHSESLNLSHFSKLFGKTAIFTGSAIVDGTEQDFERVRGVLTGTVLLKANRQTQMAVGLIALLDPGAVFPVFPSFSYKHQFNNGWLADVILPRGVLIRKNVFANGRFSLGSELENTFFYLYNLDETGQTYSLNQMEINSGLTYEHHLGGSFIATLKTGMKNVVEARVFEKSATQRDYIFRAKPEPSLYLNLGLSFNPFGKKKN
ncbi:DUF6268 family outer membrane beta-barrel protein [Pedobacter gandavensis]|uniref:DUF6268 family outer membrane beta-barrel protein n=1 Tax=Pedobacter gandavensis TaxID=2679963 RepID=UPI00292E5922|nr:DUF6268 family outer membrane beta-barrel protein [Pedobacter gandavensis]